MSVNQANIRDASIQGIFTPGDVSPLCVPENINLPIYFRSVSNIQKTDGSFTPANNSKVIHTFSVGDQANFILLVVDQPCVINLTSVASGAVITNMCVQRFFYLGLETLPSGLLALSFNGASSGPEVPMQQAIQCNYTLLYGVASIS